jgi:hypothetical protein
MNEAGFVAQASSLWGHQASCLVAMLSQSAGKMPAGPTARMAVLHRMARSSSPLEPP